MSIMDICSSTDGRILIIEDDSDIREIVKAQLEQGGHQVIEAKDGQEGIDLMKKGVKDYLVKPVEKEKLVSTVKKLVAAGRNINF